MADHHDDRLDSALNLLRSRQWAGPAIHPVLEKQFMQPVHQGRGVNPRLILCIAGALLGCGAVAAATRPVWRSVLVGAPTRTAAIASSAPLRSVAPKPVAASPRPSSFATQEPAPPPEAPLSPGTSVHDGTSRIAAATPDEGRPVTLDEEAERLRESDPNWFFQKGLQAYLGRCAAGDAQGCMDVARSMRGEKTASRWWKQDPTLAARMSQNVAEVYELELRRSQLEIAYATLADRDAAQQVKFQVNTLLTLDGAVGSDQVVIFNADNSPEDIVLDGADEVTATSGLQSDGQHFIVRVSPTPR
jgi:hypothetical protein